MVQPYHKVLLIAAIVAAMTQFTGCGEKKELSGRGMEEEFADEGHPAVYQLPDFQKFEVYERKREFFDFIRPIIIAENQRIREEKWRFRKLYARCLNGHRLSGGEKEFIRGLMERYKVKGKVSDDLAWQILMERIDVVPVPLASVQAAMESGWGTSRFARLGNNLFGQWCFRESCGMVPDRRPEGDIYEVARFSSVNESVRSYLMNLNTFSAYKEFRSLRLRQRMERGSLDSYELAGELSAYSVRRGEYINELRLMLRVNREFFDDFGHLPLLAENDEDGQDIYSQGESGISH